MHTLAKNFLLYCDWRRCCWKSSTAANATHLI